MGEFKLNLCRKFIRIRRQSAAELAVWVQQGLHGGRLLQNCRRELKFSFLVICKPTGIVWGFSEISLGIDIIFFFFLLLTQSIVKVKTSKLHWEGQLVQPSSLLWGNRCWLMMSYFQSNPCWKESFWNDTFISTSRTPGVFVVLDPVPLMAASLYLEIQSVQTTQIVTVGKRLT